MNRLEWFLKQVFYYIIIFGIGQLQKEYLKKGLMNVTFDKFSNFEKGILASFLRIKEEAKKYLENGMSTLEKYNYACQFEKSEMVQKLKELCNTFPHAFFELAAYQDWETQWHLPTIFAL